MTDTAKGNDMPLEGASVVEFSHMVLGPCCGMVLADLGADVVKIEPTGTGDKTRRLTGSGAGFFYTYNRNKQSIALDIKQPKGLEFAKRLVGRADVLIENFRAGAMDGLGLGYEQMSRSNPGLVYFSAKGFMPGPYEERAALDEVVQMMAGLAHMTGPKDRPLRAGASVNDVMVAMFGVIGILVALGQRKDTGKGALVNGALFENCAFLCGQHMVQHAVTGMTPKPMPERDAAWAVYDVFVCANGGKMFVGVVTDQQWLALCDEFGLGDLRDNADLASNVDRCKNRDVFMPRLRALFGSMERDELARRCEQARLAFAPVNSPEDLGDDPHLRNSGGLLSVGTPDGGTVDVPALPLTVGDWKPSVRLPVPKVGEHSRQVAKQAGLTPEEIEELVRDGVLTVPD